MNFLARAETAVQVRHRLQLTSSEPIGHAAGLFLFSLGR